jgi:hypothetical protein
MPGFLLHAGAAIVCLHAGPATPTSAAPRVRVSGQPVVTQPTAYTITGCPFVVAGAPSPCVTAQWATAATRVRVGGVPVLLQDSQAVCVPNGTGLTVLAVQPRVKGV